MAWGQPGEKPLSQPMLVKWLTHTLPKERLATLDVAIVDPEIGVKFETMDELKIHGT